MRPACRWLPVLLFATAGTAAQPAPDLSRLPAPLAAQIQGLEALAADLTARGAADGKRAEVHGTLGHFYFYYELHGAADDAYAQAAALAPADFRWAYYRAVAAADGGAPEQAARDLERALALTPPSPTAKAAALTRLGNLLLELGEPARGVERFEAALAIDSELAAAWDGLGRARLAAGESRAAIAPLERALALQPQASLVHYSLGRAYLAAGDRDAARQHLELWGEQRVELPDPLMDRLGQTTALSSYTLILALAADREALPDRRFFRFGLGTLETIAGAHDHLAQALDTWPAERRQADRTARARLFHVLGGLAGIAGRHTEAAAHHATALEMLPDLHSARAERARELLAAGEKAAAHAELTRLFAAGMEPLDPSLLDARLTLARLDLEAGEPARALAGFATVAELSPGTARAHVGAAAARLLLKRFGQAVAGLEDALPRVAGEDREAVEELLARLRQGGPEVAEDPDRVAALVASVL